MVKDATLELTLIELISSRICHDLVGPVGAVNAGAELMGEDAIGDDEALELMRKSGLEASRRLQLFRLAFGRAGSRADTNAMREVAQQTYGAEGKVMLEWPDLLIDPSHGRVVLNMVMLAREALPFGGKLSVTRDSGKVMVLAEGKRAALRGEIMNVLEKEVSADALDPRNVHAFFLRKLAKLGGGELSVLQRDGNIALIYG